MLIISILVAAFVIGVLLMTYADYNQDGIEFTGMLLTLFGSVFLMLALIGIPIQQYSVKREIARIATFEATLRDARTRGIEIENAAILHEIARTNGRITELQYDNARIWNLWIPDDVDSLKHIR